MKLTLQTDYALRLLIYLGAIQEQRWVSVSEIAGAYEISASHLTKAVQKLARLGYLSTKTGPGGGVRLAKPAQEIEIGKLVRHIEPELAPVPCLTSRPGSGSCKIRRVCALRPILETAQEAFLNVLDGYTLKECLDRPASLTQVLGIKQRARQKKGR